MSLSRCKQVYKQKVKHLLHEQQTQITDVRTDAEIALGILQDADRAAEVDMKRDTRSLGARQREVELGHADLIKDLKLTQERAIMGIRQEYERRSDEMKAACEKRQKALRKDVAKRKKADLKKIEARKNAHITKLMAVHKEEFSDIKNYFSDVIHNNIDLIKQLKDEVISMRKSQHADEKAMQEIAQAHKKLAEPLKLYQKEIEELGVEYKSYQKDKLLLKQTKDRVHVVEEAAKKLSWEHEILLQKFTKSKEERDMLFQQLEIAVYEQQQKAGFKRLLLEKSIEAVHDSLEKRETALHEVVVSTNLRPEAVGSGAAHSLEQVLLEKNRIAADLEDQLREWRQAYYHVVRTYEAKLDEFGIAPSEIGFEPGPV